MTRQTTITTTVVFADLMGSTGLFEATGNVMAARAVTRLTDWISAIIVDYDGRVVKTLGDGVLAVFADNSRAVDAVVEIQRRHQKHMAGDVQGMKMPIRIGVANGEVEIVAGDCFGDAVNVAARLSDLTGGHQIWATNLVLASVSEAPGVRFRTLGPINIRGRAEPCSVYQVDWKIEENTDFLTVQAEFDTLQPNTGDSLGVQLQLAWLDQVREFNSFDFPIHLGRSQSVKFVVNDPRVSREHVRIDWRNGGLVLVDVSSYGTWIRFTNASTDLLLRREECALHGTGEIALGAPFTDLSVPTVLFSVK